MLLFVKNRIEKLIFWRIGEKILEIVDKSQVIKIFFGKILLMIVSFAIKHQEKLTPVNSGNKRYNQEREDYASVAYNCPKVILTEANSK